jgi:hypothetical protein
MPRKKQMLQDARHKRDLAKQRRHEAEALTRESLIRRLIERAETLEEEAVALETTANATMQDAPKRPFGPRR